MTHTNTGEIPERQLRQTAVVRSFFFGLIFTPILSENILNYLL